MREIIALGKKIYNLDNPREQHRFVVFVGRAVWHHSGMKRLMDWFQADGARKKLITASPFPLEQATRSFFYKGSTFAERARLIREDIGFFQRQLQPAAFLNICSCYGEPYPIWQSEYEGQAWQAVLRNEAGQRKEGLLSVELNLGQQHIYQIMFWIARDREGVEALHIGAMQGPNMADARGIIKKLTKRCFGYRTKNLILYMTQAVARSLGLTRIYAVTNEGYYANNHIRADRKLKTDFSRFWQEAGGRATDDVRFYALPLVEPRKTIEEVKSQKRNLYRKRFAFLDAVDEEIAASMKGIIR
jgi:uncharacterized protein VirK/YbjX